MQDCQQDMMQTDADRKRLCETTCWTVAGGPGTLTKQWLPGGALAFRTSQTKKAGKLRCSMDGCSPPLPICVTVSRRVGWMEQTLLVADGWNEMSVDILQHETALCKRQGHVLT